MTPSVIAALTSALLAWLAPAAAQDHLTHAFQAESEGEAVATVRGGCARCDWGEAGRESVALKVMLDGRYSQHLQLVRGEQADYTIALGRVGKGPHRLTIDRDPALTARGAGPATIEVPEVSLHHPGQDGDYTALSMAPIVYARGNTVGRFTDLPLLMWYEVVPTARGRQYRYSVIFSNEDGGTKTDRLMATWGRTTDIEFVYGVELGAGDEILAEEFQGPGHEVPVFKGRHEGRHPLLWVSTDNNMVSEKGPSTIRYAPIARRFDLTNQPREAVMDANPWTYAIASVEMRREGKIADNPPPGINKIPDPRRFVFVEACAAVADAALALSIGVGDQWISSDRGLPEYRVARDGCFTIATPLPAGTRPSAIRAIRVHAFARPPEKGSGTAAPGVVNFTRIIKVFMLGESFLPGPSILGWEGGASIPVGADPFEVKVP